LTRSEATDQVFNIGSGVPIDVLTVAQALVQRYRRNVPIIVTGSFRVGDIRHNFADLGKARRLLGYYPRVAFGQGIESFTRWVEAQEIAEDAYEHSIQELANKGLFRQ
jgi:dTDP-L-rhamnose 4-epimerase